jgi:probable HAF family extracellular repeat protein
MREQGSRWTSFAAVLLCASSAEPARAFSAGAPSFRGLGGIAGNDAQSSALGISPSGHTVVGQAAAGSGDQEAFRWTAAEGMVSLGDLPGAFVLSWAYASTSDGTTIVGAGFPEMSAGGPRSVRWTAATGMVPLGSRPTFSFAYDVTPDGALTVGFSVVDESGRAALWDAAGSVQLLGDLTGGAPETAYSDAKAVSHDGKTVVGQTNSLAGLQAFRWTALGGMVGLGELPGGFVRSEAADVDADGSVIVGSSESANGKEAFRWTAEGGMQGLGDLPGGVFESLATAVSAVGDAVVGQGKTSAGQEAFLWTPTAGMRRLADVLEEQGVNLSGWTLTSATDISANGRVIVGDGINPRGVHEAWIATLVPEPTGVTTLISVALATFLSRRRHAD